MNEISTRKLKNKSKDVCFVFVPKHKSCAVSFVRTFFNKENLNNNFQGISKFNLIDVNKFKIFYVFVKAIILKNWKNPKRVILFSHSFKAKNNLFGFDYFKKGQLHEVSHQSWLKAHWWTTKRNNLKKYDFLYAHVCFGNKVLRASRWEESFPNYVAFDHKIMIVKNKQSSIVWSQIFNDITQEMINFKKDQIHENIRNIYRQVALKLEKEIKDRNLPAKGTKGITLMYLKDCLIFFRSSEKDYSLLENNSN